jgi:hypothetical protein
VAPTAHGATHGSERHEDQSDKHQDDPDGPQNRDLGKEPNEQQDDSEDDHSLLLTAVAVCSIDRQPQSRALSASLGPGAYQRERQHSDVRLSGAPVRYVRMTLNAASGSWWSVADVRAYVTRR